MKIAKKKITGTVNLCDRVNILHYARVECLKKKKSIDALTKFMNFSVCSINLVSSTVLPFFCSIFTACMGLNMP